MGVPGVLQRHISRAFPMYYLLSLRSSRYHTLFGCLRRLASSALAADAEKSGPASICVDAASWNPYTYARVFVRQGFNGAPEVVTVTDADRAGTPSSMDRSELGAMSSVKNQEQCGS